MICFFTKIQILLHCAFRLNLFYERHTDCIYESFIFVVFTKVLYLLCKLNVRWKARRAALQIAESLQASLKKDSGMKIDKTTYKDRKVRQIGLTTNHTC